MKPYKIVLICIIVIQLFSCRPANDSPEKFTIPMTEIGADVQKNKYLQIIAPAGWNSFKTGEVIALSARNVSENQISVAPDFGLRIFIYVNKAWVEVKNNDDYQSEVKIIEPSDDWYVDKVVDIFISPDLPDDTIPYHIRIFLIGDFIEDGKSTKKVGGYIDLRLTP